MLPIHVRREESASRLQITLLIAAAVDLAGKVPVQDTYVILCVTQVLHRLLTEFIYTNRKTLQ